MVFGPLAGNYTEGEYLPVDLYAGESDIITTNETVAAGLSVLQYTVMGKRGDGYIVPLAPGSSDTGGQSFATGSLTFGGQPTAADTVSINGVAITFVAAGPVGPQVLIGGTPTITAQNLKAYISAHPDTLLVNAGGTGTVLTLTAENSGVSGNAITLAKSGTYPAVSGATMTGGAAEGAEPAAEGVAFCIMAQAVDATAGAVQGPVFTGGVFNHAALIWPASLTTETQRRRAFDRSPISVKSLK